MVGPVMQLSRNIKALVLVCSGLILVATCWMVASCRTNAPPEGTGEKTFVLTDQQLLDTIQYRTFQYFWGGAEPNSGMARERYHVDGIYPENDKQIVTSGGSGFGLMALVVGMERGYITRQEGVNSLMKITGFLEQCDRFHGAWPHWMNGETGRVKPFSPKDNGGDLVETA